MSPHESDRRHIERQIAYARPIVALLALIALLEQIPYRHAHRTIYFLIAYLFLAVLALLFERMLSGLTWHLPLACDLMALGFFIYLSPTTVPAWFPYLFVCYAAGIRWGLRVAFPMAGGLALLLVMITAVKGEVHWMRVIAWLGLVGATLAAGGGSAFLGDLSRSLERIFVWQLRSGESERLIPENLALTRADGFLLDDLDATICWNSLVGAGAGFGCDRRDVRTLKALPRLPSATQQVLALRSFMSVSFEQMGQPAGRLFLLNGRRAFRREDLMWFERVARHVGPSVENIFLLRHLRARAIEGERSRISRDLHDGILQTLLSIEIQLDVLRRRITGSPEHTAAGLANLQQTVKNESAELRHMVTDLRPLRVQSADLIDLMRGFAERYRNESALALDVLIDSVELHAPDRVCREIFQIYREALNNIKKHAKASHVVVKLSQDDSRLVLVVDDNGEGFSFAGRFTGDELDRLRLGPISIKERTRTVGGVLTVESNPGHGARLTIEVPLG